MFALFVWNNTNTTLLLISFDCFRSNSFASAALLLAWNNVAQLFAGQIHLLVVLVSGMNKRHESTII